MPSPPPPPPFHSLFTPSSLPLHFTSLHFTSLNSLHRRTTLRRYRSFPISTQLPKLQSLFIAKLGHVYIFDRQAFGSMGCPEDGGFVVGLFVLICLVGERRRGGKGSCG